MVASLNVLKKGYDVNVRDFSLHQNPRLEALRAKVEKEAAAREANLELENAKTAIQCFLDPTALAFKSRAVIKVFRASVCFFVTHLM